jgi:hypothetical protein
MRGEGRDTLMTRLVRTCVTDVRRLYDRYLFLGGRCSRTAEEFELQLVLLGGAEDRCVVGAN